MSDIDFRLDQELEAYKAQLEFVNLNFNRNRRRQAIESISSALSSSIYGHLLSKKEAKSLLTQ